jgi:hypothetical protein
MFARLATPMLAKLGVGIIGALLITLGVVGWLYSNALGTIEDQRGTIATLRAQMQVIEDDAKRRSEAARRALEEAHRTNAAQRGLIDGLRQSASRPRDPNEPCTVSPELRAAEGAL